MPTQRKDNTGAGPLSYDARRVVAAMGRAANRPHAGLIFDRYLPLWVGEERIHSLLEPLLAFTQRCARYTDPDLLTTWHERLERASPGGRHADFRVEWRLASGLGIAHPTENGFVFDPVIGVPFLPGSSVKGLTRAAAETLYEDAAPGEIERLLGGEKGARGCGDLIFFDAYPRQPVRLGVDIVNCHQPAYYFYFVIFLIPAAGGLPALPAVVGVVPG